MKYRTDLILGEAFCLFIFFYFLDSGLSVLNGLQFYFWLRDSENREFTDAARVKQLNSTRVIKTLQYLRGKNAVLWLSMLSQIFSLCHKPLEQQFGMRI